MTSRLIDWAQRCIARGYVRAASPASDALFVLTDATGNTRCVAEDDLPDLALDGSLNRIGVLLPTFVERSTAGQQSMIVEGLVTQIAEMLAARQDLQIVFFVGMQWRQASAGDAIERLEGLARLVAPHERLVYVGVSLRGRGKTRTVNAAIQAANRWDLEALAWVDDDVYLEPRCLARMLDRFVEKRCRGALGATKIPIPGSSAASRILFLLKSITAPATNYPHACCILVDRTVIARGIPDRYASDDGFVCFELLDPSAANPLYLLELVPDARCWHVVGGPGGETLKRIRRMLTNHLVFLADYPREVSQYYFSHILFYGLWPIAPFDLSRGLSFGAAKWFLKLLYFCWFSRVGLELALRGLVNRPIREIEWGGYTEYSAPGVLAAARDRTPAGGVR